MIATEQYGEPIVIPDLNNRIVIYSTKELITCTIPVDQEVLASLLLKPDNQEGE